MSSSGLGKGRSGPSLPAYYGSSKNPGSIARAKAKAGPNRSTKASGKLKILPEEPEDVNATASIPKEGQDGAMPKKSGGGGGGDDDDDDDSSDEDDSGEAVDRFGTTAEEERSRINKQLALAQIPEGSMRRDARRLTRKGRASLPRVTAYSTATSYRMRELTKWLQARRDTHRTNVMTFDECVYTTYTYELVDEARGISNHHHHPHHHSHVHNYNQRGNEDSKSKLRNRSHSAGSVQKDHLTKTGDLLGIPELQDENEESGISKENGAEGQQDSENGTSNNGASTATLVDVGEQGEEADEQDAEQAEQRRQEEEAKRRREEARLRRKERFSVHGMIPEIFFMEYGTVVIWGMSITEEKRLLRELRKFEVEKLAHEDVESEELNWYLADYSRIYNDVITLRRGSSYMTKLSLSHALAQSTKISFFEGVIDNTIDTTKDIPQSIAESGKIGLPPVDIMKQIGHLFILRMNIHLVGSIVDSPEIFWAQPDLEPLYSAARSYLEIPQRIELLNARVEVLQDMLQLLKDQVTSSQSEWLEIIVIVLILLEIVLGVATMIVDLYFA